MNLAFEKLPREYISKSVKLITNAERTGMKKKISSRIIDGAIKRYGAYSELPELKLFFILPPV